MTTHIDLSDRNPDLFFLSTIQHEKGFLSIDSNQLSDELSEDLLVLSNYMGYIVENIECAYGISVSPEGIRRVHTPAVFRGRDGYLLVKIGGVEYRISEFELTEGLTEDGYFKLTTSVGKFGRYDSLLLNMFYEVNDKEFSVSFPFRTIKGCQLNPYDLLYSIEHGGDDWIENIQYNGKEQLNDLRKLGNLTEIEVLSARPIETKFGQTYVLTAVVNGHQSSFWSHKNLNPFIESKPIYPFTVSLQKTPWRDGMFICKFIPVDVRFDDTDDSIF